MWLLDSHTVPGRRRAGLLIACCWKFKLRKTPVPTIKHLILSLSRTNARLTLTDQLCTRQQRVVDDFAMRGPVPEDSLKLLEMMLESRRVLIERRDLTQRMIETAKVVNE